MEIKIFEVGPFMQNTYLLIKEDEAILVDPGFFTENEYSQFKQTLNKANAQLIAIVLTHAHVDHVMGIQRTLNDFNVKVYLNTDDLFLWQNFGAQTRAYGINQPDFDFIPESLPKNEAKVLSKFNFECLFTPGHSPDHTALYFAQEKVLISGDAIFKESIGRTDLYKGDFEVLADSIQRKIYSLPDSTIIYPGHGESTSVGYEKLNNQFVRP